jgi:hypothetical protein
MSTCPVKWSIVINSMDDPLCKLFLRRGCSSESGDSSWATSASCIYYEGVSYQNKYCEPTRTHMPSEDADLVLRLTEYEGAGNGHSLVKALEYFSLPLLFFGVHLPLLVFFEGQGNGD